MAGYYASLAQADYCGYREMKADDGGRFSPRMLAAMGELESKLAVRGVISSQTPSEHRAAVSSYIKAAEAPQNRALARQKLEGFLQKEALTLDKELRLLATYLISGDRQPGGNGDPLLKYAGGPLKTIEKAMGKTEANYDFAYGLNTDLVRGTLICDNGKQLSNTITKLKGICTARYGMFVNFEGTEVKSVRDAGGAGGCKLSPAGYSGWNFVIQFKDHPMYLAELQANTADVMYGKMSKSDFCRDLQFSEGDYVKLQTDLAIPGGLGHALYDIQDASRSPATAEEKVYARNLSLDYYDACRHNLRQTDLTSLQYAIKHFGMKLTTQFAKDHWRKAVAGSGWNGPQLLQVL